METFMYIYSTLNGRVDLNDYRIKLYGAEFKPTYIFFLSYFRKDTTVKIIELKVIWIMH